MTSSNNHCPPSDARGEGRSGGIYTSRADMRRAVLSESRVGKLFAPRGGTVISGISSPAFTGHGENFLEGRNISAPPFCCIVGLRFRLCCIPAINNVDLHVPSLRRGSC